MNEEIHVSFVDINCCIPKDIIDKIFLPFFTTKDVGKGTGLGFSICNNIIKNLGGRI
ncbi:MAG: ATP-binding protein [Candidatus Kapaibacteriales bacterium]